MKTRNKTTMIFLVTLILIVFLVAPTTVMAAEPVDLGTTASFAVLAGTTITNTGPTIISGDIGVSPGSAITGFPPGSVVDGKIIEDDAVTLQAQNDLTIAYLEAESREVTKDLTGDNLGGMILTAGVYSFSSSAQLTGTLILDAQDDPDAVFIFKIVSDLTTAPSSVVSLVNGAVFCRVFWQVGSSAILDTNSIFIGHIFALTSISAKTGATVHGQLLARNGAVTLDSNTINSGACEDITTPTDDTSDATTNGDTADETTNGDTADETTTDAATAGTTTDNEAVPQTGESDNYMFFAIIILGLAGSLAYLNNRRHKRE